MKKIGRMLAALLAAALLCAAMGVLFAACGEGTEEPPQTDPVKVADGIDFDLAVGAEREFAVADYITANGNTVSASSAEETVASAAVEGGTLTVSAVSSGETTVTLTCGEVTVTFGVTVYRTFTVSVDGEETQVRENGTFTLPAAPVPKDENMQFVAWLVGDEQKQPQDVITVTADVTVTAVYERKAPVKVADGIDFDLAVGAEREFAVADYITTYGNAVSVSSEEEGIATAEVADGVLTIAAVSSGETTVTLTCGDVTVTFGVTVYRTFTVSVDGEKTQVRENGTFTLPAAPVPEDENMQFVAWQVGNEQKQPQDVITVTADVTVTAVYERKAPVKVKDGEAIEIAFGGSEQRNVADYITTYGNAVSVSSEEEGTATAEVADGVLTIAAVSSGETTVTLTCGEVTVTFTVTVALPEVEAPVFANGAISFDLFETGSGSYTFGITAPAGVGFSYKYALAEADANASFEGNTLVYTAAQPTQKTLTVNVTATATVSGETVEKTASFTVTVTVTDTTPAATEDTVTEEEVVDLYLHVGGYVIDLAANISNAQNIVSYTVNGGSVSGTEYTLSGEYGDTPTEVKLTVVAVVDGKRDVEYTYTLFVIDSSAYRMQNGSLEDGDTGWTGMNGSFSEDGTYFGQYPVKNDGRYYVGIDQGTETVQSPAFVVGGSGWITFKLGSMKPADGDTPRNIYLAIVDAEKGTVLAQVRNVLFEDPAAALKLNDYKLDLSQFKGDTVFIRAVDNENGVDFRSLYLDAFVTWYAAEPADTYTDLTHAFWLDAEVAFDLAETNTAQVTPVFLSEGVLSVQYTYAAEILENGLTADGLALKATKSGVYTVTYTVSDGEEEIGSFSVTVTVTNTTQLPEFENAVHNYAYGKWETGTAVNVTLPEDGERFSYSYSVSAGEASIDGKTLTYTPSAAGSVQITVTVTLTDKNYTVTDLPTLSFTVTLNFADSEIALAGGDSISVAFDVNDAEIADKEAYTLDFAQYLVIPADKTVSYAVTMNEDGIELDGSSYTLVFAELGLNETEQEFVFAVTATSGETQLEYTVTLRIKDTYQYRLYNGGFDLDLDGWTLDGMLDGAENDAALGGISEETGYWENDPSGVDPLFYNDGKFFSAYAAGAAEGATGTLRSSNFIIGGSGWITYKLGGAKNIEQVYLEVVSADGAKRVTLPNFDWSDNAGSLVRGCTLVSYRANLIEYGFSLGEEVYLLLTDNGANDYGLFFLDSVVTYYPVGSEPDDSFNLVSKYRLLNGGFETGSLMGWELTGDIGVVSQDSTYWNNPDKVYGKEGEYLFTWWSWDAQANDGAGAEVKREGNTGTLKSRVFTLKKNAIVSFLFGGGGGNQNIYLEFVNAETDEVLAKFYNTSPSDGRLVKYWYEFAELSEDTQCYLRVTDNATSGWGCFALDGVETNLAAAPDGYNLAVNQLSADV